MNSIKNRSADTSSEEYFPSDFFCESEDTETYDSTEAECDSLYDPDTEETDFEDISYDDIYFCDIIL